MLSIENSKPTFLCMNLSWNLTLLKMPFSPVPLLSLRLAHAQGRVSFHCRVSSSATTSHFDILLGYP